MNAFAAGVRVVLAALFVFTGVAHFVPSVRDAMIAMVPESVPSPALIVAFTGVCEIAGAIGLLVKSTRRTAAWALIVFLVAVFPANARAAREGMLVAGRPATPLVPRAAIQLLLIGLVGWSGLRSRP